MIVMAQGHIERLQRGIPPAQIALQFVQDAPQGKEQALDRFHRLRETKTPVVGLRDAIGFARIRTFAEQSLQVVRQLHAPAPCQCIARQSEQLSYSRHSARLQASDDCGEHGQCAERQRCDRLAQMIELQDGRHLHLSGQERRGFRGRCNARGGRKPERV